MHCFLCIKTTEDIIKFNTIEADQLHIKKIIEKHFWLQINDAPETSRGICIKCWNCLKDFHEFYTNIETAHKTHSETTALAEVSLKVYEDDEAATEDRPQPSAVYCLADVSVKAETDYLTDNDDNGKARHRKRLRLKRQALSQPVAGNNQPNAAVDPVSLNEIKIELPEADPTMEDVLDDRMAIATDSKQQQQQGSKVKSVNAERKPRKHKGLQRKTSEYDEFIRNNFKLHCLVCNDQLADFTALNKHYRSQHKSRGYAMCCNKKFYERSVLVDHLHSHKDPEYFKCHVCAKILSDRQCLEQHMMMHDTRKFKCETCSKSFYKLLLLKRHQLTHMPKEQRTVHCTQCEKTFPSEYLMQMHLKSVHLNLYAKICDVCGKLIRSRELLERHMAEHTGVRLEHIQCDICGVSLTTVHGLKRHKKMMHDEKNRQPIQCPVCSKTSPNLAAHKNHMQFMHSMARKHQCPMCEKAFKRNSELRDHMTTHTGEELYTCPYCPKTFKSNANRHKHRKKMHPVEWEAQRLQRYKQAGQPKETNSILATSEQAAQTVVENNAGEI